MITNFKPAGVEIFNFKPTLKQYGRRTIININKKKVLMFIVALPIGSLWLSVFIPFVSGVYRFVYFHKGG